MKVKNISKIWTSLFIIILLFSTLSSAKDRSKAAERHIYVGDLITLKIDTASYTLEDLAEKFNEFEIVKSRELKDGYELTLRTFNPGEYTIILGNKKLEILVSSTLETIERDSIFPADLSPLKSTYNSIWLYLFISLIILLILAIIILIWQYLKKRREKNKTPYQHFLEKLAKVQLNKDDYFVELTFLFKEYLEDTFTCQLRGKTAAEIMVELNEIKKIEEKLGLIEKWLRLADYYKFTTAVATVEVKEKQRTKLKDLVTEIEETIQVNEG